MANEITTLNNGKFELVPFTAETAETIREELDGLDGFRFDEVKIPSGGSLAFEVPGDDPETPEMATSIEGIIAYHHSANARWEGNYTGDSESNAPVCISNDGVLGYGPAGCTACKECPYNEFGSADDKVGKACKNMKRVYILRSGETLPLVLVLPPTSIRPFREYLGRLVKRGKKPSGVITRVTLKKEKSQTGIIFSRACFEKTADLSGTEIAQIADVRSALENFLSQQRPPETGDPDGIGHEIVDATPGEFTPF
jgi:hypothetical protein